MTRRPLPLALFEPHPARRMRIVATGLLIAMMVLFIVTQRLDHGLTWVGYLEAFAEAALVGGLADWFAVVALFRHPMGLPIPHTAIVPKNKDRLAENLAGFLQKNFLTPSIVARRLAGVDMAGAAARWLATPPDADRAGMRRGGFRRFAVSLMDAADNDAISALVRGGIASNLERMQAAPLIGRILDRSIDEGRLQPVFDNAVVWLARVLDENEMLIRDLVQERTQWLLRIAGVDERVANAIINGMRKLLVDMAADPGHPLRIKVMIALKDLAFDLRYDPDMQARVDRYKQELIANPELGRFLDGIWGNLKDTMKTALTDPDAALSGRLGEGVRGLGATVDAAPELKRNLNKYARRVVTGLVADYGTQIVGVVSDTVKRWDTATVSDRLERAVGRDLQFIRVNGTLVGGLVGVVLHTLVT
ncbi:MAG: DUF445 domain-containing protein, partial [Pseudomonadota bacterium]